MAEGMFTFLGETRALGSPPNWRVEDAPRLWSFELHYFDWAREFVQHADRRWARQTFQIDWGSWLNEMDISARDAWAPYTTGRRAWNICSVFDALLRGSLLEEPTLRSLRLHEGFLQHNLELDLRGNHLLNNLKALLGLAVFFDRSDVAARARAFAVEASRQVLQDGGHYERSPSYHADVLADVLDVVALLESAETTVPPSLLEVAAAMRDWLGALLTPTHQLPLFNDSHEVPRSLLEALGVLQPRGDALSVLGASGFLVFRPTKDVYIAVDIGGPGPPEAPGHAHAGSLGFELMVDGRWLIVDSGTSTYEPGARRSYERSTAAHNTVEVDERNQTDLWGAFRVGRRANASLASLTSCRSGITAVTSHDGYRHLSGRPLHRRRWRVEPDRLEIKDQVFSSGSHHIVSRLHFAPDVAPEQTSSWEVAAGPITVRLDPIGEVLLAPSDGRRGGTAREFGPVRSNVRLEQVLHTARCAQWRTTIRWR